MYDILTQSLEYTAEHKAEAAKYNKECRAVSGFTDQDEENLVQHKHQALDKEKVKKHFTCIAQKAGYVNAEGKIDIEEITKKAHEAKATPEELAKILECAVDKENVEHTAVHFFRCKHNAVGSLVGTKN